tara:strand:+ start:5829 stop:6491 length:663 start_codon:yes stop_codon:yes gene_type:complete
MVRQYFQTQYEVAKTEILPGLMSSILLIILIFISFNAFADENASILEETKLLSEESPSYYQINAGDVLSITVWNDPSFSAEQLLVRPDGFISAPVVGEIKAGGQTIDQLQKNLSESLSRYLKDEPTVVITILATSGSQVFVLGKVNAPGAYPLTGNFDVTQAIAMARGLNSFASENKILVLRRDVRGVQQAIEFEYGKVRSGKDLSSNILLNSGDVVVVP